MIDLARSCPAIKMRPTDVAGALEMINVRREYGKTYQLDEKTFRASSRPGPVHYRDDYADRKSQWHEIDLLIDTDTKRVTNAPYNIDIYADRIGYSYTSRRGGHVTVELVEIDGTAVNNGRFTTSVQGHEHFWNDVETGLDMRLTLRPLSAEIFKLLKDEHAPRRFRWRIREGGTRALFRRRTRGWDASGGNLEITTGVIPITSGADFVEYFYDEEWTGRVGRRVDPKTRKKEWFTDPVYPIKIDATATEDIVANNDDGFEYGNWISSTTTGGQVVWWNGYYFQDEHSGLRFQTLGVPQGVTISAATITVVCVVDGGQMSAKIYGDDVDSAGSWSNGDLPSGITKTAGSVSVAVTATGTFTWNVTNIVQTIISRGGWSSGNNIRFAVLNQLTGGNTSMAFYDYGQGPGNVAQLDVTYGVGARQPRYGFTLYQIPGIV